MLYIKVFCLYHSSLLLLGCIYIYYLYIYIQSFEKEYYLNISIRTTIKKENTGIFVKYSKTK